MSDSAARVQRASALEEKRKKLEDLKKKRALRDQGTSDIKASATNHANLDDYIDGLLSQPVATAAAAGTAVTLPTETGAAATDGQTNDDGGGIQGGPPLVSASTSFDNVIAQPALPAPMPRTSVETFTIGTQTDVEDFPEQQQQQQESNEEQQLAAAAAAANIKQQQKDAQKESNDKQHQHAEHDDEEDEKTLPKLLSSKQVEREVSSTNPSFSSFINTASKKVERVLGTPLLSDLLVDHVGETYGMDSDTSKTAADVSTSRRFVSSRQVYECYKWTLNRDVTDIDWSPLHRELFLSTYHMPHYSSSTASTVGGGSAISAISPKDHVTLSSASLTPRPRQSVFGSVGSDNNELQSDGLCLIWNLSMSNRPEHVFTCGSPVTSGRFHAQESTLVIGGCQSGQLVIWDVRAGRLPVQKSAPPVTSSSSSSSSSSSKGHVHPITCMQVIEGGSGLVTSSPDGRVNFWSLANLREPAESIQVGGNNSGYDAAGICCFGVAPESEALLLGDEHGGMHAVASVAALQSGSASGSSSGIGGVGVSSSGGGAGAGRAFSRKQVRKLDSTKKAAAAAAAALTTTTSGDDGGGGGVSGSASGTTGDDDNNKEEESLGHYGMVTAISTKILKPGSPLRAAGLSKGFLKGMGGLVLSSGVDWTVKLWSPATSDAPLLSMVSHSYDYMSDVKWNPVHPSLFATASSNGTIGLWNLAISLDEPITGQDGGIVVEPLAGGAAAGEVADTSLSASGGGGGSGGATRGGLNKIQWSADGRRMAVASGDRVHVLLLSDDVVRPKGDEETKTMNHLVARGLLSRQ